MTTKNTQNSTKKHTHTYKTKNIRNIFNYYIIVVTGITTGTGNKNNLIFKIVESPP